MKRNLAALLPKLTDDECLWCYAFVKIFLGRYGGTKADIMLISAQYMLDQVKENDMGYSEGNRWAKARLSLIKKLEEYCD